MLSLALIFCFICSACGQIKWVETGALNRCGDNLCAENEVCLRPRHYLYPFVCFDVNAVPCLKSGLPLPNCYYSDYSTTAIRTTDSTTTMTRPTFTSTRSTSTTTRQTSTTWSSTILATDSTSAMSTATRETTTIHPTESSSPIGATQASTLAVHLGLNLHTALLAGGFILLLALICGMAVALLCFLESKKTKNPSQNTMALGEVSNSAQLNA